MWIVTLRGALLHRTANGKSGHERRGDRVFDDPQTVIGAIIGVLIIAGGTAIAVLAQRRRERDGDD